MSDANPAKRGALGDQQKSPEKTYQPPKGANKELILQLGKTGGFRCEAVADWMVLRKKEKPVAEIFHVSYRKAGTDDSDRPVTFVFNGGPGAASAYLHLGALGPKRVQFNPDGSLMKPPARLVDNAESWLPFTDLVFVDPVGTGFSRVIPQDDSDKSAADGKEGKGKDEDEKEFYRLNRDLDSLGEFISKFLSKNKLWSRPVFVAGESYGGFRVGKLARKLQEGFGVGLNGAILISPALEFSLLEGSDYDILMWTDLFPSMALAALHHGRSRALPQGTPLEKARAEAEKFASEILVVLLARGDLMPESEKAVILVQAAGFLGLPERFVQDRGGRVSHLAFARELLRDQRKVCGLYDATATAVDPFPDRENFQGADPTLFAIERIFTGGINHQLRDVLGLETERDYHLLSLEVNNAWKVDTRKHDFESQVGATDDLRYGMSLNSHMKVFITHGYYDLVTPYFSTERLSKLMKLAPNQAENLSIRHFKGGHMFYVWEESRRAFRDEMEQFYRSAL